MSSADFATSQHFDVIHATEVALAPAKAEAQSDFRRLPQEVNAPQPRKRFQVRDRWLVVVLLLAVGALGLRLAGTLFGLPHHYHWDEPTLLNRVIRMGSGDLNPHYFWYPTLLMYAGLVAEGFLYMAGHLLGIYRSPDAFAALYFEDSTAVYLLGRVMVAVVGSAIVVLTYIVGRRFFSTRVGVAGALLVAAAPIQVASSHFFTTDIPMTFFVMLSYVCLWNVYTRGSRRDYALTGCTIGLGIATKYLPALLVLSLLIAHLARLRKDNERWWPVADLQMPALGMGLAASTFFVTSPFVFLDWRTALHDYGLLTAQKTAQGCVDCSLSFGPYITQALPWSVGLTVYVAGLAGLISLAWQDVRRRWELILFWSFPILLFIVVGAGRQPLARYLVSLAPFLCLAAADVFWRLGEALAKRVGWGGVKAQDSRRPAYAVAAALTAVALLPTLFVSARYDVYLTQSDPRTEAEAWFDSHVPSGTTIAVQPLQDRYFLTAPVMTESQLATLEGYIPSHKQSLRTTVDDYFRARPIYPDATFTYDVSTLRSEGVRYVILTSAAYHNVDPTIEDPFYADLARHARVAAVFAPPMNLPDASLYPASMPTITIYELTPAS